MVRCCVREELQSVGREDAPEWTVTATGSAIAVACLACVGWSLMHDRGLQSELAAEGASLVIDPAEPKSLVRTADAPPPQALLMLDRGENVAESPVVNAHLEYFGDGGLPKTIDVSSMIRQLRLERNPATDPSEEPASARSAGELTSEKPATTAGRHNHSTQ